MGKVSGMAGGDECHGERQHRVNGQQGSDTQKPEGAEAAGLRLSTERTFQRDKGTDPEFGVCLGYRRKSQEASGIGTGRELWEMRCQIMMSAEITFGFTSYSCLRQQYCLVLQIHCIHSPLQAFSGYASNSSSHLKSNLMGRVGASLIRQASLQNTFSPCAQLWLSFITAFWLVAYLSALCPRKQASQG